MKLVRADEHDIQVIAEIHRHDPLDLQVLVTRYREEMGHAIGDRNALRTSLLLAIETLFGPEAAESVERELTPPDGIGGP